MTWLRRRKWPLLGLLILICLLLFGAGLRVFGWLFVNRDAAYVVVPDWPRLPAGLTLGQVTGIDVDSQGRVYVFARGEEVSSFHLLLLVSLLLKMI